MFLHLELKVFLWDSPSFASARAPGVLVDQDSRAPSALCVCAFDQGTDASPPPPSHSVSYWCLGFLVTDHVLYLCMLCRCFPMSCSISDKVSLPN